MTLAPKAPTFRISALFLPLLFTLTGFARAGVPRLDAPYVSYLVGLNPDQVAVGDLDGKGPPDLVVTNRSGNSISVLLAQGGGVYGEKIDRAVGLQPAGVAVGDFNGDGLADVVTANVGSSTASVLLSAGNGTFGAAPTLSPGGGLRSVAVADLNGDGRLDLCFTRGSVSLLAVMLGNGNGTFQPKVDYTTGAGSDFVALGLLNSDGFIDAVTANSTANTVSVLLGNGNGTFASKADFPSGGGVPVWVAIADFSGDGKADLAVANRGNPSGVGILLGNGVGSFIDAYGTPYVVDGAPYSVALGDLNGDGRPDLVTANRETNTVAVRYRMFPFPPYFDGGPVPGDFDFGAGMGPTAPVLADLSGDGRCDIATVSNIGNNVTLLFNHARPSNLSWFEGGQSFTVDGFAMGCAIGQLAGGGPPGIAVAVSNGAAPESYVATMLMNGDGSFGSLHLTETAPSPYSIAIGTFDASAPADLAVSTVPGLGPHAVTTLKGNGDGSFGMRQDLAIAGDCWSVASADLNGDGFQDLAGTSGDHVAIFLGNGDGTFDSPVYYTSGGVAPDGIAIGQLNGVGGLDVAVVNLLSGTMCVLFGNGDGTLGAPTSYPVGASPEWVAIGDFNEDGALDIATVGSGSGAVSVLLNTGSGSFAAAVSYPTGNPLSWIAIGDLDADGHQDIVTANPGGEEYHAGVTVFPGRGNGTFANRVHFGTGRYDVSTAQFPGGYSVAIGDLNADGRADLAVPIIGTPSRVLVLFGQGPTVSAVAEQVTKPTGLRLATMPNPAIQNATFTFDAPRACHARLDVFDVSGRLLATPLDAYVPSGLRKVEWKGQRSDGTAVASGVYCARLQLEGRQRRSKFIWMR